MDLEKLVQFIRDFAGWYSKTEAMFLSLADKVERNDSRKLDSSQVEAARTSWTVVGEEYLQYKSSVSD